MILAQRIRLDPNNVQRTKLTRYAGAARFAWNWSLARWKELYESGEQPSWQSLNAELNARKRTDLPWLREIPWAATNGALSDLGAAFCHFFRRIKTQKKAPGYPRFKKRGCCSEGFTVEGRAIAFDGRKVYLPKLGWVRTRQLPRFLGKIKAARVTQRAGHWYLSVQVEVDTSWSYPHRCETQAVVGMDWGVKDMAVLSDGRRWEAPRSFRRHERKLRMLNKQLSRRTKGGRNRAKTKARLARLHERIANVRSDFLHKMTTEIVRTCRVIGIEDLAVSGLARTRLAKSVLDAAPAEVRRQLEYKAPPAGSNLVVVGRFFPSSKTCHVCGRVNHDLRLSDRTWTCTCGAVHDRDDNAAQNLKQTAAAHAATACCPGSSGPARDETPGWAGMRQVSS